MKSRKLTIAECCLKYGVGAYHIDACRVGSEEIVSNGYASGMKDGKSENGVLGKFNENHRATTNTGRFPSNFILSHTAACELLGFEEEEVNNSRQNNSSLQVCPGQTENRVEKNTPYNTTTTIAKWNCSPKCPCKLLDEQSGIVKTGTWNQTDGARTFNNNGKKTNYKTVQKIVEPPSGASRFFKQFESEL